MSCGAVVLAAGASTRLGSPKQIARLGMETLLDRTIRIAREADCAPIVVVLGANETVVRERCKLQDVVIVSNPDWAQGMGTSIARGATALLGARGILVMTCDMPAVSVEHLRNLVASGEMAASSYADRKGVPAFFPGEMVAELVRLNGEVGARELLHDASVVELPGGEIDVDTPGDLIRVRETFSPDSPCSRAVDSE